MHKELAGTLSLGDVMHRVGLVAVEMADTPRIELGATEAMHPALSRHSGTSAEKRA